MFNKIVIVIIFMCLISSGIVKAKENPLPIEAFAAKPEFSNVRISPDGKYLANRIWLGERFGLVIVDRKNLKPTYLYKFDSERENVGSYHWVNNERVVFNKYIRTEHNQSGRSTGELYAGNFDGSDQETIFGINATGAGQGGRVKKITENRVMGSGEVLSTLKDNDEDIVVLSRHYGTDADAPVYIYKVNVYTGKQTRIAKTPIGGNISVIVNNDGEPVFANGLNFEGVEKTYLYKNSEWLEISRDINISNIVPLWSTVKGDAVYFLGYEDDKKALFRYELEKQTYKKLYEHTAFDIFNVVSEPVNRDVVAVEYLDGYVKTDYLYPEHSFAKIHKAIRDAFSEQYPIISSSTQDNKQFIVTVISDRTTGDYYLFDTEKMSMDYLLSNNEKLDPNLVGKKVPIKFKARDGFTIYGYMTLPPDFDSKQEYPLLVMPHGGPYGVQDKWFFDGLSQPYANAGYIVLQVNYRGSGGYGKNYEELGYGKPHTLMMYDIVDGTKWAMQQDYIQERNACVFGWSFGGYSAAMLPTIEPELFKCSIAGAGVYDMVYQQNNADYKSVDSVYSQVKIMYGDDPENWRVMSPIYYVDKVQIPMMLIHGGKDARVPPQQAERYKKALEDSGVKVRWLYKDEEPHSFNKVENRVDLFKETIEFLDKHLKD